jgi:hypothetical protein
MIMEYSANSTDHSLKRSGKTITITINKIPKEGTSSEGIIAFWYMNILT